MARYLPGFIVLVGLAGGAPAGAQSLFVATRAIAPGAPVAIEASASGGRLIGVVTDEAGRLVGGASILALGTSIVSAQSDSLGRFTLALPFGDYIVRAVRDGYVSTYREPMRMQGSVTIERHITLVRSDAFEQGPPSIILPPVDEDHSHSEMAWRLRHLTRTVLRDTAHEPQFGGVRDWIAPKASRASAPSFALPSLSAQVNFLTTSSRAASGPAMPAVWPHGIADVVVGAPALNGDWLVRAAVAANASSSWTLVGEYVADRDRAHAFRAGVSYSAQVFATAPDVAVSADAPGSRSVGGVFGVDHWRVRPGVNVDYGLRIDRYDYLDRPMQASGDVGVLAAVTPHTYLTGAMSHRMIAPGADQFLPPVAAGPWLPPERTFSALTAGSPLLPERVDRVEIGIARDVGVNRTLSVRWFSESAVDQLATLFGLDSASDVGHYYVATPGDVTVDGWSVRLAGQLVPHVKGSLDYVSAAARWYGSAMSAADLADLSRLPESVRRAGGRVQDLQSSLEAIVPRTATRILVAYRLDNGFSTADDAPAFGGRFSLEVRQALPYRPTREGTLNLLVAVRNLLRDVGAAGSLYDELLTVAPPVRLTVGVQMGF